MSATILLVDDDAEIRELLELLLTGEGYAVLQADSGEAALDLLGQRRGRRSHHPRRDDARPFRLQDLRPHPRNLQRAHPLPHRPGHGHRPHPRLFRRRRRLPVQALLQRRTALARQGASAALPRLRRQGGSRRTPAASAPTACAWTGASTRSSRTAANFRSRNWNTACCA